MAHPRPDRRPLKQPKGDSWTRRPPVGRAIAARASLSLHAALCADHPGKILPTEELRPAERGGRGAGSQAARWGQGELTRAKRVQGMGRKYANAYQCQTRCYDIHDATCSCWRHHRGPFVSGVFRPIRKSVSWEPHRPNAGTRTRNRRKRQAKTAPACGKPGPIVFGGQSAVKRSRHG